MKFRNKSLSFQRFAKETRPLKIMRRGGGLYSNFVSANDEENRPYRGAEIPPPSILQGRQGKSIKNFRFISSYPSYL